jgi:eukaryotic-like serine/threonine-protein kinase
MRMPVNLMMAIGKAALHLAGFGLIGDVAEIAKAAWEDWKQSPEERLDELEAVIRADDAEVERAAEQVTHELAAGEPEPVRAKLATFLKQVPSRIRQSQRRPADPTGRTIRPGFVVNRPEDLIPFIPDQFPRFKPGDQPLVGVDWVLVELLVIGGFGEVWKARNAHFDSFDPVALKFCTDPLARQRLLRHEAKVLDRVRRQGQHPGIVSLRATYLSADPPCLEYEYVEGGDLGGLIQDWYRQAEKPSCAQVAGAMVQLAEIVAFAHRLDPPIVHRDLKPANILVQRL